MGGERSSKKPNMSKRPHHGTITKLPSISKGSRIQKRPLNRRQPPSSSKSHIVYISTRTPFMASVQRVRKILDKAHLSHQNNAAKHTSLAARIQGLEREAAAAGSKNGEKKVEVLVTGTGKALEKVLSVAAWFEDQGDCEIEVRTGTVGTVDDVVDGDDGEEEEESRVRRLSKLEVVVRLK
ncbi:rpp20 subunit of nuclear RNase MRP and P domain-containing protein [Sarocladium implicatum]|nr:rpp20 subunit of nuclear RNase MRP and P domain-containing protein [Sarocladium implicatum]